MTSSPCLCFLGQIRGEGFAKPVRGQAPANLNHARQTPRMEPDTSGWPHALASAAETPEFRSFFEALPGLYLVVRADAPRFTIVAASDARLRATLTTRTGPRGVIGLGLFEAFPDPPDDPGATGERNLRASLERAIATGMPDRMAVQAYPIPRPDGTWEERHWSPLNTPVRDPATGQVTHLIHQVEDVTESVQLADAHERLAREKRRGEWTLQRAEDANTALTQEGAALREANQALQDQAVELEMQAEELRDTAVRLEERTEEAEAERARATGILEAMADAYFALDAGFRITAVNAAMEANTRLPREALLGRVFWDVFPGTLGTAFERHYRAVATNRVPVHFQHDYSDGRLELVASVDVYPAEGGGIAVFWRDIGELLRSEAERERLLDAERRARADAEAAWVRAEAVLASIADAFYLLDREWRFTYVNDAAEPLLQTTREKLLGRTLWEAFPGVAGSEFEAPYRQAMGTGEVTSVEAYFEPLGTWFDVRTYPWAEGVMVHFRDIGARKRADAERERLLADAEAARADAEAANQAKSQFLTTMSHELRTPLNAIAGYTELLMMGLRGALNAQQMQDVERVQRANQHLTSLVNDVLNFARLDAGRIEYHLVEFDLAVTVAELEPLLGPQLAAKGIAFDHDACAADTPEQPHRVHADPEKLRQILLNLLTNAVKFTDAGGRVSVRCESDAGARTVRVHVTDTGRGIPANQLEHIFEPFVQIERNRTQESQQGVGLGLAISRDLARGMGGSLTAASEVGVGSTFTLTVPLA